MDGDGVEERLREGVREGWKWSKGEVEGRGEGEMEVE